MTNNPLRDKGTLLTMLLLLPLAAISQSAQHEINEQVWKPFIKGLSTSDTDLFLGVHSKDLVRAPREANEVYGWQEYYKRMKAGDEKTRENGMKIDIDLRFTERIAQGDLAIEVGVYKTTMTERGGTPRSFYGRFHVVLRKESGVWKILVDTDSSERGTIGEPQFLAAKPMEE